MAQLDDEAKKQEIKKAAWNGPRIDLDSPDEALESVQWMNYYDLMESYHPSVTR
jgi:hypothetical protein